MRIYQGFFSSDSWQSLTADPHSYVSQKCKQQQVYNVGVKNMGLWVGVMSN